MERVTLMNERDQLLIKKHELEQLIAHHQWSAPLSAYSAYPSDMHSNLQILNIELEKINDALGLADHNQIS
jgi:hypothetical protein